MSGHSHTNEYQHADTHVDAEPADARQFWDARYAERPQIWSGRVNKALADTVTELTEGTALDLGCGEGGDSVWLAESGWRVTGVDISATALARARDAAQSRGLADGQISWRQIDLSEDFPAGTFDLVSACFLASPVELPRATVLQHAADAVASGGTLLVVSHAAPPPWARHAHGPQDFPTPDQELETLDLDDSAWEIVAAEIRTREATGQDHEHVTLDDTVIIARRR